MAPRGYLLLEIAIGGALLAVLISVLLTALANARVRNVKAGRDAIAAQLVQEQIERERSVGFAGTPSSTCDDDGALHDVTGQTGVYRRSCDVAPDTRTLLGVTLNLQRVTVVVEYTPEAGAPRRFTAITEVFQ
jgi:type II secretory pathway pseudopilin PulG